MRKCPKLRSQRFRQHRLLFEVLLKKIILVVELMIKGKHSNSGISLHSQLPAVA